MKKILFINVLCIALVLNMVLVYADTKVANNSLDEFEYGTYQEVEEQLSEMSIEELNELIDCIANESENTSINGQQFERTASVSEETVLGSIQVAWLAAAKIAYECGYTCGATMIEYSLGNQNYYEPEEGYLVTRKVRDSSAFVDYIDEVRASGKTYDSRGLSFEKSDNSDLFYALHNVDIYYKKSYARAFITIKDTFNFERDNDYDSFFSTTVNNWAWLSQHYDVLNPISIQLEFTYK